MSSAAEGLETGEGHTIVIIPPDVKQHADTPS